MIELYCDYLSVVAITYTSDIMLVSSKEFLDIQATIVWIHSETCT